MIKQFLSALVILDTHDDFDLNQPDQPYGVKGGLEHNFLALGPPALEQVERGNC